MSAATSASGLRDGPLPPPPDAAVSVREVLALPAVARGVPEVLAGEDRLGRTIRWVHSGEVPYMAEMLKGGEFLLMTGLNIARGEREQRRFIAELDQREIAALAIELGARFKQMPRALASEANRRSMPLIALNHEIRFVDVTEAVHREIVSRQFDLMRHGDVLQRRFTSLMLKGAGIPELLVALSEVVANPVVLEKSRHGLLYHAPHELDSGKVLSAWDSYTRGLPGAPPALDECVPSDGPEPWGRLVALGLENPVLDSGQIALQRAAGLIGLTLLRERTEEALVSRDRGNFLATLMDGEVDEAEVRQRAAAMGFLRGEDLMLPIAATVGTGDESVRLEDETLWARVWRDLQRELASRHLPFIAGVRNHERQLLLVLGIKDAGSREPIATLVSDAIADASTRHLLNGDLSAICVGPWTRTWAALGSGLEAAVQGLARASSEEKGWYDVSLFDLDSLLWSLRDQPDLRRFAIAWLERLVEHDRRHHSKLLPTLAAFCRHGGHKAETARSLHIERQSLYHRLARIESVLEVDLSDPDTIVALHIALRAIKNIRTSHATNEDDPKSSEALRRQFVSTIANSDVA